MILRDAAATAGLHVALVGGSLFAEETLGRWRGGGVVSSGVAAVVRVGGWSSGCEEVSMGSSGGAAVVMGNDGKRERVFRSSVRTGI